MTTGTPAGRPAASGARIGVVTFPGSLDDRDAQRAVRLAGATPVALWHADADLRGVDAVVLPGGFSYGDYLRTGAIARFSPVMRALKRFAAADGLVMGICNGFQILVESGLLPGTGKIDMALAQNVMVSRGKIVRRGYYCDWVNLRHDAPSKRCSGSFIMEQGSLLKIPIAHGEGNLVTTTPKLIEKLNDQEQVVFRYCDRNGRVINEFPVNVNGSTQSIAGICNPDGNVLGMMPHPERASEPELGCTDGYKVFESLVRALVTK